MTEKEVLDFQEHNGQREFILLLMGTFYHTYGHGAFALSRATGYRVTCKHRKWGELFTAGFPVSNLEDVIRRIEAAGGIFRHSSENRHSFSGIDGTPDVAWIAEQKPQLAKKSAKVDYSEQESLAWLVDVLLDFNLSLSTPLDAMNLIGSLQRKLRKLREGSVRNDESQKEIIQEIACESPAGQGLQE